MTDRSIAHGSFTIERTYKHPVSKVFSAWSIPANKSQWFGMPDPDKPPYTFEFKEGGREYSADKMGNDEYIFDLVYADIVPDNRIIYTYQMHMNGKRISVSLATIEFFPTDGGTRMVLREDGAFLDGLDKSADRESGTNYLVDQIGLWLDKQ
jgi:uncharacterized protein YndB with AHSA1/START domain